MTDVEAEAPILCPPHGKSQLIGKDSDSGKDWGHGEKGATEDEIVGWHHWVNGHDLEQTPGDWSIRSLVCCSPWCHKKSDMTSRLDNNNKQILRLGGCIWSDINSGGFLLNWLIRILIKTLLSRLKTGSKDKTWSKRRLRGVFLRFD